MSPNNRSCALSHLTPQWQNLPPDVPSGSAPLLSQILQSNQYLAQLLPLVLSLKTKRHPKFYLCNRAASKGCCLALHLVLLHTKHCKVSLQTTPMGVVWNGTITTHWSSHAWQRGHVQGRPQGLRDSYGLKKCS